MNCNDCIHQTACFDWCRGFGQEAELCEHFSDKAEWVHLPVKVGDTVYQPSYKFTKCSEHDYAPRCDEDSFCCDCESNCNSVKMPYVYKGTVCVIRIAKGQIYIVVAFDEKFDSSNFILGKTVFLTREEAEKKLDRPRRHLICGGRH